MPIFDDEGRKIYYEVAGSGSALLLINGIAGDTRQWAPLVGELQNSFQTIIYDMRCSGKSSKPDEPFGISDLAGEAHRLLRHLGHKSSCVLGFSMGGMVAMSLACRYPESVGKLFLVATAPSASRPHPLSSRILKMFRRTDVSSSLFTEVYESIFGPEYKKKVSAKDFIDFRTSDENPQPAFAYLRQLEALESGDLFDEVERIKAPTIVITGEEDAVVSPANSEWLAGRLPGAALFKLKGIGHMVPAEATGELARIVLSSR